MSQRTNTPALVLSGLRKRFGHIVAVDGIDLTVQAGEIVALLGPNGAGKSTALDLMLGLAPPDGGSVQVWGRKPADACRAGEVGALEQTGGLRLRHRPGADRRDAAHLAPSPAPR